MLKVRIVEVQRNAVKQLGFNLQAVIGRLGQTQFNFGVTPPTPSTARFWED